MRLRAIMKWWHLMKADAQMSLKNEGRGITSLANSTKERTNSYMLVNKCRLDPILMIIL
jgi:hypothetical protein